MYSPTATYVCVLYVCTGTHACKSKEERNAAAPGNDIGVKSKTDGYFSL